MNADNPCAECGGACCSFRRISISYSSLEPGERYDSHFLHGDHIEQLVFDDGSVPAMDWYVLTTPDGDRRMVFECGHLTDDGKCGEYDRRPGMCKAFECAALDDDVDTTLDEFLDAHRRPAGFPDEYDLREVTDRVHEILRRRSDEEDWPEADGIGRGDDTDEAEAGAD